jgi:hypothetical protein
MIWSPGFFVVAERVLKPVNAWLDREVTPSTALWILAIPFLLFPVIVVHELGHLLAGLAVHFRFLAIRVGHLRVTPPFQVSFRAEPDTGASGYVQMVPGTSQNLRLRSFIFILGGPLANLLLGSVVLLLNYGSPGVRLFAVLSIIIGAVNLVPFQKLATTSDGKRIISLLRNDHRCERWLAIVQLVAELQNGADPKNLSPDFLAKATAFQDESADTVAGFYLVYAAAWHASPVENLADLLEICLIYSAHTAPSLREALRSDAAVFQARKRKRVDLAEQWLAEIPEKTQLPGLRIRVEAAILEAHGDIESALKKLDQYLNAVSDGDRTLRKSSLRSIERWRSELQSSHQHAAVSGQPK